jgi:hypothetical protein
MNIVDVYDVANSTWYKQATSGATPEIRVNPCAIVAAAADGSSFQVYLYGGQDLVPYGNQTQYDDIWILTIPSFTWIKVDTTGQSNPPARAGHSCNIWDAQMIVIGGYVGQELGCDSPGIYVFDLSNLKWINQFTALSTDISNGHNQSQQRGQQDSGANGLLGSYGYQVPSIVQSVIGGNGNGGATVTAPVQGASDGPIATGKPPTFTVTQSGSTITQTSISTSDSATRGNEKNIAAIVAGIIAGLLAVLAAYLGFCAWVYRRQLNLYKNHVALVQRASTGTNPQEKSGLLGAAQGSSSGGRASSTDNSIGPFRSNRHSSHSTGYANLVAQSSQYGVYSNAQLSSTSAHSSETDLLNGREPSFLGVVLNPRRSLRVINLD